ncbi:phage tail tube protein [Clostridium beijerinckii]|uniref:phage tail tube protein n=1 Tax=Clostridium beijerinckii TaxID=1520 RepID=UPI0005631B9B|nr:phage tail tube protein [Clostridium beijerinckii]
MSKRVDPYKILLSNQGYMKIDNVEIAELKELEIKVVPDVKEINLLNSVTKGKFMTSLNGIITFEFNKVYSRFKPAMLECLKYLQYFTFTLEANVKNVDDDYESIYIGNCWLEGDMNLFSLKADTDFLTEKFTAGFQIESAQFVDVIQDKHDWETSSYKTISNDD